MSAGHSLGRQRMLYGPGYLYAAYSRYCDWIKLGFSTRPDGRLLDINRQYSAFAPFSVIGMTRSTWNAEQQLHDIFTPFRQRNRALTRELYPAAPSLVAAIKTILANQEWQRLKHHEWMDVWAWARRAASAPINHSEATSAFERFCEERKEAA